MLAMYYALSCSRFAVKAQGTSIRGALYKCAKYIEWYHDLATICTGHKKTRKLLGFRVSMNFMELLNAFRCPHSCAHQHLDRADGGDRF